MVRPLFCIRGKKEKVEEKGRVVDGEYGGNQVEQVMTRVEQDCHNLKKRNKLK
jgi:hypothetical protein